MNWQPETLAIFKKFEGQFKDDQYALRAHRIGKDADEPLYVMADALIRYAKQHRARFEDGIGADYYCLPYFKSIAYSIIQLASMDGGVAMSLEITTDSKDNSVVNELIEEACRLAGVDYETLSL